MSAETVFDWSELRASVDALAQVISSEGFAPDLLVAIARGGWVPSRLLSDGLHVKRLTSIGMTYVDDKRTMPVAYSMPTLPSDVKTLLLVEDYLESGRSMKDAKRLLEEKGVTVRTAALWVSPASLYTPDFSLGTKSTAPGFPWETAHSSD